MTTTVHNLRSEPMRPGDIRIDRRTEFGNEFIIGRDGSRADVIAKFEIAERARLTAPGPAAEDRRRKVRAMHGRRLFCWCAPESCHGNVYAKLAAELVGAGREAQVARGRIMRAPLITREMLRAEPRSLFVFGDNIARTGRGGQAAAMRGEPNALGVPTKWRPGRASCDYFTDADADRPEIREPIVAAFRQMRLVLEAGQNVVIPAEGLGIGLADLPRRAPRIHRAIEARIEALETFANYISD